MEVLRFARKGPSDEIIFEEEERRIISEISLKILVNGEELVSLLCMNQAPEELALGFLYSEGIISGMDDIRNISYHERMHAVLAELAPGIAVDRQESLRSMTSGCGKCYTYINPLKKSKFRPATAGAKFSLDEVLASMKDFDEGSEIFRTIGGVHSVLFRGSGLQILFEDIGRHNCFDKITGYLLKHGKMDSAAEGILYCSGRISSEIMTKVIRLGVPLLVSRTTPTTAAVKLAREYDITLLGYVRGDKGVAYSGIHRFKD